MSKIAVIFLRRTAIGQQREFYYTQNMSTVCRTHKPKHETKNKINKLVHATLSSRCCCRRVCINYLHDNELVNLLIVHWDILKALRRRFVRDLTNDDNFLLYLYIKSIRFYDDGFFSLFPFLI